MNRLRFVLIFPLIFAGSGLHAQTATVDRSIHSDLRVDKIVKLRIAVKLRTPGATADSWVIPLPLVPTRYSAYGVIDSVNGEPARGWWSEKILTSQTHQPGGAYLTSWTFDIIQPDGTPAGVITAVGVPDDRGPVSVDLPVVGSTSAYFGAHGTISRSAGSQLFESGVIELNFVATLLPLCKPAIAMLDGLPAMAHAKDFTPVTSSAPAEPGEIISLVATNLLPALKDSPTWPSDPEALSNAPVTVKVDGVTAKILYVGKYPSARNAYQINFQVPVEVHAGIVDVQISTGYIDGPIVSIPVR